MIGSRATILLLTVGWVGAMHGPRVPYGPGSPPAVVVSDPRPAVESRTDLQLLQYVADSTAFHVASVLIAGDTEAILIDTQFLAEDARRVADQIAATGKRLKAIFITHPDHDHYTGAAVILDRFPGTPVYMTAAGLEHFNETGQRDFQRWKAQAGDLLADSLVTPVVLPSTTLAVDNAMVEIIPDLQGDVMTPSNSVVWIPSSRTLIAGDLVFNGVHAWLAASSEDTRRDWRAALARLGEMQPASVIAGHKPSVETPDAPSVLSTMIEYLTAFDAALSDAQEPSEVADAMRRQYSWTNEGLLNYSAGKAFDR